ncbi:hypothetical protein AOR13_3875 [Alteromonas stellipolaris LMG 21856]|nr:hypothetical protein AOR13_3875 [Alteromonas stellipolaris LMG 21856]
MLLVSVSYDYGGFTQLVERRGKLNPSGELTYIYYCLS